MVEPKVDVPEKHQEFCRAVARLARDLGLNSFGLTYQPGYGDPWRGSIQCRWDTGRHGEDENKIFITSTMDVHTKVDGPKG